MVKIMKNPYEQMDDLGGFSPYFWFNTHMEAACDDLNDANDCKPKTLCDDLKHRPFVGESVNKDVSK